MAIRLRRLRFAGFRVFSSRSPSGREGELQELVLAPLTLIIGRNNSGKSACLQLTRLVLNALAAKGENPFPLSVGGVCFANRFKELLPGYEFFRPLDIQVLLEDIESNASRELYVQLIQRSAESEDEAPVVRQMRWYGADVDEQKRLGLLPDNPDASAWRRGCQGLLTASHHLGPAREDVERSYPTSPPGRASIGGQAQAIGHSGEYAPWWLFYDRALLREVSAWAADHLGVQGLRIQQEGERFRLLVQQPAGALNLADAGEGLREVAPILTLALWRKMGKGPGPFLDVYEEPELHLHDAVHAPLGDLLLNTTLKRQGTTLVETHSEALLLRVQRRIAEGLIPDAEQQVALYFVDDSEAPVALRRIHFNPAGEPDWWPEGVFAEAFEEVKAIRRAQRSGA